MGLFLPLPMPRLNYGQLVNRTCHLNDGLVAWWLTLPQRGRGNTFFDIAARYHGTLTNGPTWGGFTHPGGYGSINFDGSNDSVDLTDINAIDGVAAFTLSHWICPTTDGFYVFASKADAALTNGWLFQTVNLDNTDILFYFGAAASGGQTSTNRLTAGVWHHLVVVFDGSLAGDANRLKIYWNGAQETLTFSGLGIPATMESTATSARLGGWEGETAYFNGKLDDVRFYARALSSLDVFALHQDSRRGYQQTLNRVRSYSVFDVGGAAPATNRARYMPLLGVA